MNARLFAAVDLPLVVRETLVGWTRDAVGDDRAMRLIGPEWLHVTLCFIGWREVADAPALGELVVGCAAAVRDVRVARVLWLAPSRPHVLTVGIDDPRGELAALQARVSEALERSAGYVPDARGFVPHVTVARVRRGNRPLRRGLPALPAVEPFACPTLTLYRSQLAAGGARYEALAQTALPA